MKQTLQLRLSQHLALTPQLQQSIRLLQLSTLDLNQEIEQFLLGNPLLERDEPDNDGAAFAPAQEPIQSLQASEQPPLEESSSGNSAGDAEEAPWSGESFSGNSPRDSNDEDNDYAETQTAVTSLRDHLLSQLGMTHLSERDRSLVLFIVEALDDDGYMAQSLEDLAAVLPAGFCESTEEAIEELMIALRHVQSLDPSGVAARNPRECLELQLQHLDINDETKPLRELSLAIVSHHLEQLAARDFTRIRKALGCCEDDLRAAHTLILSLNPRPGAQYSASNARYVTPDVMIKKVRGKWTASLNREAMPRLRINRMYADILQRNRGSGLAGQLQEAKWLIKNVQQRFDTILRVSQAIVDRQRAFFDHGEVAMRPLTLREIADVLSLHESTISRVTTQKYLSSPRGTFELKYFFGSHVSTDSGGAASSTAIRALIKQLVSAEDGHKPLSDSRIAEILGEQGIVVARRTVAKYRESLSIPPVNLRKSF
ncbi:MAG: RNA polymerase factor sigma-54 [Georgfuchsia sp.]